MLHRHKLHGKVKTSSTQHAHATAILLPELWSGNSYVDWVGWDEYQSTATKESRG